jgi:signal transduction histidine kinase
MPCQRFTPKCLLVLVLWLWLVTPNMALATTAQATFAGWLDKSGSATVETVQTQAKWETFSGWKGWAFGSEPVWLRVQVPAVADRETPNLILTVRPPFLDKVTFYDPVLGVEKKAGDFYPAKDDALGSVLFTFEVPALDAERYVLIKLQSTSTRLVHLSLLPLAEAQAYTRFVEWVTGFVLVLSVVFLAWALVHWMLTRERLMGIFAIKQAIITIWGFLFFGFGRITLGPLFDEGTLSLIGSFAVSGLLWSGLWFFATLLQDYKARLWMLRCMQITAIGIACLSLMNFFGYTNLVLRITNTLMPVFLSWIVLTLWFAPNSQEKFVIKKYVLMSYLLLHTVLHAFPTLMYVGLINESPILSFGNMGLLVMDGFVMLMILSARERRFKEQHQAVATQLIVQQEQARLDQQYVQEQRQLLAMLAHEMKTPLSNLRIWMEAGPKGRPAMQRAIGDMDRVIERCVHAGQLSDQSLKPHNEWLDVSELTQSVLATSRQPQRVQWEIPSEVCVAYADVQMLSIVLSNMLENAYKYSEVDTPIALALLPCTGAQGLEGWQWTLENKVGEAGFPDAQNVFNKYYRSANAKRQSGSGLGLFLVKSLLNLMHGHVIYTPLKQHVRFEFWIPVGNKLHDLEE